MKARTYLLGGLILILGAIQLVPNELPAVQNTNPADISNTGLLDEGMRQTLKNSCYDCHSNETSYPWYSYVAPLSWLVAKDVREGREELNFSHWADYDMMEKLKKLDDIAIEVGEGEMPMEVYTVIHSGAKLNPEQIQEIVTWAENAMDIVAEEEE
ncbi:MAG: cytochrome C [Cytophagales bacterium]|nr:MAG: cytochrome C [Cytophagales bacterium]